MKKLGTLDRLFIIFIVIMMVICVVKDVVNYVENVLDEKEYKVNHEEWMKNNGLHEVYHEKLDKDGNLVFYKDIESYEGDIVIGSVQYVELSEYVSNR